MGKAVRLLMHINDGKLMGEFENLYDALQI